MAEQTILIPLEQRAEQPPAPLPPEVLKLRRPERNQITFAVIDVEALIPLDHPARAIWELTGQLDLRRFAEPLRSRTGVAGRPAWEPRLLVSVWIWAYSEGIGAARELERLCAYHPALQWLCGLERICHKTLSDFRTTHGSALDELFTQVLALLSQEGVVDLEQVMVDGTRIRSQSARNKMRRRGTVERHLAAARQLVETLGQEQQAEPLRQQVQARRQRAARERLERLQQALQELPSMEAKKAQQKQDPAQTRVSITEPEARLQRESNGGWAPGYNAQFATAAGEKIVVGVALSNETRDTEQLQPTLADVQRRLGEPPQQVVADEAYASRANVVALQQAAVELVAPAPNIENGSRTALKKAHIDPAFGPEAFTYDEATDCYRCPAGKTLPYRRRSTKRDRVYRVYQAAAADCCQCPWRQRCCPQSSNGRQLSRPQPDPVMESHREWMQSARAQAAYRRRAEVAEFPNACLKERIGLRKFRLLGLPKARLELLWAVLAYNVGHWIRLVWRKTRAPAPQPAPA